MTARLHPRLRAGALLVAATLAVMLAGCSLSGPGIGSDQTLPAASTAPTVLTSPRAPTGSVRIVLRLSNGLATATLDDTPAAREFAAMLPLQLKLHDPMGQAKSGPLPRPIDATGLERVFHPAVGEIYYSAPSSTFAIFYDDLGQSIPDPGLVRLGVLDSGLDAIDSAGNRFTVQIDLASHTRF
ncbi:MAG TPA: cyclophilin-like fold protein [Propionibacteriaceae bacterium]